jgi:hypothetical protein
MSSLIADELSNDFLRLMTCLIAMSSLIADELSNQTFPKRFSGEPVGKQVCMQRRLVPPTMSES